MLTTNIHYINYLDKVIDTKMSIQLYNYEGLLISLRHCFITETRNRQRKNKIHPKIRLLKTDLELKYYLDTMHIEK